MANGYGFAICHIYGFAISHSHLPFAIYHIIQTMRRENGNSADRKGEHQIKKENYANAIKATGCVSCGYSNKELPRFFHMDHINPLGKINNVSTMVITRIYSIKDIKNKCSKCLILCQHCHILYTKIQIKNSIISGIPRENWPAIIQVN
jgi:hypothetical protein